MNSQHINDLQKCVMSAETKINELVGKIEQLRDKGNDRQLRDALGDRRHGACDFIN